MGVFDSIKKKLMEEPGRALAEDQAASANKQKEIKANYKMPGYDQTPLEKTRRTAANAAWDPATSKEPVSPVISRKNRQDIGNSTSSPGTFNGKVVNVGGGGALTLGGKPVKEAMFIKSEAAKGLVPQPGTASAIPGMQQNPALTTPGGNMTGIMNQETAMLNTVLQGTKSGANFGQNFGQASAAPGGAPQIGDRAYRDLEKNITDMRNQQKALMSGNYSPSAFGTLSPTRRMAMAASLDEQIKGIEDTLFNRSSLANDLVKALVSAQSGENIAGTAAAAGTEQEKIKAGATMGSAAINAGATQDAAQATAATKADSDTKNRRIKVLNAQLSSVDKYLAQDPENPKYKTERDSILSQLNFLEDDDELPEGI